MLQRAAFVIVVDGDQYAALQGQRRARAQLALGKGMTKARCMAHDLAGGAHLRPQHRVDAGELLPGQHRLLDKEAVQFRLLGEVELGQRCARHDLGRKLGQGHARRLADKGHRATGSRVDLQHVDDVVLDGVLNVHQPAHAQGQAQLFRILADDVEVIVADLVGRQHAGAVAGVDARLFDVLHDAADHDPLAVADRVHVHFDRHLPETGRSESGRSSVTSTASRM